MSRIHNLFNVSKKELPRIYLAWSLVFILRLGFILGWTASIAHFLSTVSVEKLPFLFFGNASLVIVGTLVYKNLIHRISKETLVICSVMVASTLLILASSFAAEHTGSFFSLVTIAQSIFLSQSFILISLFNEELFTPLESQRTFPIIESAETLGGMLGGLLLSLLAGHIPSYKFVLLWAILVLLILPILLLYKPQEGTHGHKTEVKAQKHTLKEVFHTIKGNTFLWGIMLMTFLNWAVVNMLEFQYTIALQEEFGGHSNITEKLGILQFIFNSGALFVQLIMGSRILSELGVISTMVIHPLVTLFNLVWMLFDFRFMTAAITKGSYETTGLLFKSATDSSFYAIDEEIRGDIKELTLGIMKPLGALVGTSMIFFLSLDVFHEVRPIVLNILLFVFMLGMLGFSSKLGKAYTHFCEKNLSRKRDIKARINAIEILSQKGHHHRLDPLIKIAKRKDESKELKYKILACLAQKSEPEAVLGVLEVLDDKAHSVKESAAKALAEICQKNPFDKESSFTRYKTLESIKGWLKKDLSEQAKEDLVRAFFFLDSNALAEHLLKEIDQSENSTTYIKMLKLFSDPHIRVYLEPYLDSRSPEKRAAAICALWKHEDLKPKLRHGLKQLLENPKEAVQLIGLKVLREVLDPEMIEALEKHSKEGLGAVRDEALLTLAHFEEESVVSHLLERLTDTTHHWSEDVSHFLSKLPRRMSALLRTELVESEKENL